MPRAALVIAAVVLAAFATAAPPAWSDNPSCPSPPEAGSWVKEGEFKANSQLESDDRRTCTQRYVCNPRHSTDTPECRQVATSPVTLDGLCRNGDHASRGKEECKTCFIVSEPRKPCESWLEAKPGAPKSDPKAKTPAREASCPHERQHGEWLKVGKFEADAKPDSDGRRGCTQNFECRVRGQPSVPSCHEVETPKTFMIGLCRTENRASKPDDPCTVCFIVGQPKADCVGWLEPNK